MIFYWLCKFIYYLFNFSFYCTIMCYYITLITHTRNLFTCNATFVCNIVAHSIAIAYDYHNTLITFDISIAITYPVSNSPGLSRRDAACRLYCAINTKSSKDKQLFLSRGLLDFSFLPVWNSKTVIYISSSSRRREELDAEERPSLFIFSGSRHAAHYI